MLRWWTRLRQKDRTPALSRPSSRLKTYSAESGYVYSYRLLGFRSTAHSQEAALGYTFEYRAGKNTSEILVLLFRQVLTEWEEAHGRELSASERFGLATVTLRSTFDLSSSPEVLPREVCPTAVEIEAHAVALDL